jgi:hypothetical protein
MVSLRSKRRLSVLGTGLTRPCTQIISKANWDAGLGAHQDGEHPFCQITTAGSIPASDE